VSRPSARALDVLEKLRALTYAPRVDLDEAMRIGDLLRELAQTGEWRVLPRVAAIAFSTERLVLEEAAPPIAYLAGLVPAASVPWLDRSLRAARWYAHLFSSAWWELRPGPLPRVPRGDPTYAPLVRLAMSHPSGWVREAAVRSAAEAPAERDLPYLLVRTRDWVPAVRAAALAAVAGQLREENAGALVALLPLVETTRLDPGVGAAFAAVVASRAGQGALEAATQDADPLLRRAATRRLIAGGGRARFVRALADRDAGVRLIAGRALRAEGPPLLVELGAILRGDRLAWLRALGLEVLRPDTPVQVADYLADRSAAVRAIARARLVERGGDARAHLRAALLRRSGRALAAALEGLAEVATGDDAALARPLLADPSTRVRRAALHLLVRAGAPERVAACLAALADAAPRVSHAAAELLPGLRPPTDAVGRAFIAATSAHGRADAARALLETDYWRQLPYLLRAPPSAVRDQAIGAWLARRSRVGVPAPADALADARAALGRARLDGAARAALAHILGG
jgi:hypothetical protein